MPSNSLWIFYVNKRFSDNEGKGASLKDVLSIPVIISLLLVKGLLRG